MTIMIREPECVTLKRRGAEYVAKLLVGMSLQEQLEFWRNRTEAMLNRQENCFKQNSRNIMPTQSERKTYEQD